jgi:hypothetical protein
VAVISAMSKACFALSLEAHKSKLNNPAINAIINVPTEKMSSVAC